MFAQKQKENVTIQKRFSWNVFFVSTNLYNKKLRKDDANDKSYFENDAIYMCTRKFKEDVEASVFSKNIKLHFFEFEHGIDDVSDSDEDFIVEPVLSTAVEDPSSGLYQISKITVPNELRKFNCLDTDHYVKYFKFVNINNDSDDKNLVIFLSHSFGAGFLPAKVKLEPNSKKEFDYYYFTTVELNDTFKKAFLNPIDCLMALNCNIQSVETNAIFRDTVKLLLGSQQELFVEILSFKSLIYDLSNYSIKDPLLLNEGMSDEHIFSKYILNCHDNYIIKKIENKSNDFKPFNIALTKPEKAKSFMSNLNFFAKMLEGENRENNLDLIRYSKNYCDDPSSSDIINIVDAKQFFDRLLEYFEAASVPENILSIKKILNNLNNIIVFKLITGNSTEKEIIYGDNIITYLPNGIGIFVRKVKTINSTEILKIYNTAFHSMLSLDESEWMKIIQENNKREIDILNTINNLNLNF